MMGGIKNWPPPLKLVGSYLRKEIAWEKFEQDYLVFLQGKQDQIRDLIDKAKNENITLLCIEPSPEKCHRRLIAEECSRLDKTLQVVIR